MLSVCKAEKLDIEQKEMLALGEKISNAREKLSQVPEDKKERAKELLGIPLMLLLLLHPYPLLLQSPAP